MVKVTSIEPVETPSQELVRKALAPEVLTDAAGRKLLVRKPGALAQYRLVEAAGPERAQNQMLMNMLNPLVYLAEIEGEPVMPPSSPREIDALINRLDHDGLAALNSWYIVNVIGPTADAIRQAEQAAAIKN